MAKAKAKAQTVQVNLRISPELKEAAEAAAAADHRSLTSLVAKLLTDYCRATGYLPPETPPSRKGKAQ
jgi:predicted HicB family RNase H-like nuclease